MEFENTFDVDAPIEEVWKTLLDVERVAPCVPGAEVLEQTGENSYKVAIKVRVGPMSMQYKGDIDIVDADAGGAPGEHARAGPRGARPGDGERRRGDDAQRAGRRAPTARSRPTCSSAAASRPWAAGSSRTSRRRSSTSSPRTSRRCCPARPRRPATAPPSRRPAADAAESVQPDAPSQGTQPASQASEPSKEAPRQAPAADAELSAMDLVVAVAAGRLKDPRAAGGLLAVVVLLAFLLGRRSAG